MIRYATVYSRLREAVEERFIDCRYVCEHCNVAEDHERWCAVAAVLAFIENEERK